MLEKLPVAIALVSPCGRFVGKTGALSGLLGDMDPSFDALEASRWCFKDASGADIPAINWPSGRALRGERDYSGMIGMFIDGERRKVRVTSIPTFDPASGIAAVSFVQALDSRGQSVDGSDDDLQERLIDALVKAVTAPEPPR